jgi:ribonuclease-3
MADAVEAVLGAVFLDAREAGDDPLEAAAAVYERLLGEQIRVLAPGKHVDPKSRLQHWAQGRFRVTPTYERVGEPPPPESPHWRARVELRFDDGRVEVLGEGEGRSLKTAERVAAEQALATNDDDADETPDDDADETPDGDADETPDGDADEAPDGDADSDVALEH